MKVSSNYLLMLEVYLEWEGVRTPASGLFQEGQKKRPLIFDEDWWVSLSSPTCMCTKPDFTIRDSDRGLSAAECLCLWESRGIPSTVRSSDSRLLHRYVQGKSQRDWWTKEIGWLNQNACYVPEEFLSMLGPLPFIELFGRGPITRIVRHYFDNHYSLWEFKLDSFMLLKQKQWGMHYYEADERHSAVQNAWRMIWVKWVAPAIFRIKHRSWLPKGGGTNA